MIDQYEEEINLLHERSDRFHPLSCQCEVISLLHQEQFDQSINRKEENYLECVSFKSTNFANITE